MKYVDCSNYHNQLILSQKASYLCLMYKHIMQVNKRIDVLNLQSKLNMFFLYMANKQGFYNVISPILQEFDITSNNINIDITNDRIWFE